MIKVQMIMLTIGFPLLLASAALAIFIASTFKVSLFKKKENEAGKDIADYCDNNNTRLSNITFISAETASKRDPQR